MAPITPADLGGTDTDLARRVLVRARTIAPLLDTLDGERRLDAIAVLKGVIAEIPRPGESRLRGVTRNGTGKTFDAPSSWFSADDELSLRSLFETETTTNSGPAGHFPAGRPLAGLWPEERYS